MYAYNIRIETIYYIWLAGKRLQICIGTERRIISSITSQIFLVAIVEVN